MNTWFPDFNNSLTRILLTESSDSIKTCIYLYERFQGIGSRGDIAMFKHACIRVHGHVEDCIEKGVRIRDVDKVRMNVMMCCVSGFIHGLLLVDKTDILRDIVTCHDTDGDPDNNIIPICRSVSHVVSLYDGPMSYESRNNIRYVAGLAIKQYITSFLILLSKTSSSPDIELQLYCSLGEYIMYFDTMIKIFDAKGIPCKRLAMNLVRLDMIRYNMYKGNRITLTKEYRSKRAVQVKNTYMAYCSKHLFNRYMEDIEYVSGGDVSYVERLKLCI